MKPQNLLLYAFISVISLSASWKAEGQSSGEKPTLDDGTVEEQFEYVIDKSHMYEDYRVIKSVAFNKLKKHVTDTMKLVRYNLAGQRRIIAEKDIHIDSLNQHLQATQDELELALREKNSLKFIGIPMVKQAYNSLVWIFIGSLSAGLIIFLLLYKRSHAVIRQARADLESTKEEFENHRKRALEREEQVVRKYHAELNKYKEKSMTHKSGKTTD
jgi:hypothetical protein